MSKAGAIASQGPVLVAVLEGQEAGGEAGAGGIAGQLDGEVSRSRWSNASLGEHGRTSSGSKTKVMPPATRRGGPGCRAGDGAPGPMRNGFEHEAQGRYQAEAAGRRSPSDALTGAAGAGVPVLEAEVHRRDRGRGEEEAGAAKSRGVPHWTHPCEAADDRGLPGPGGWPACRRPQGK